MTGWVNAYGCVSLWWLGSVTMAISGRVLSKIFFGLRGTDPCHKCGICTHGVVFIRWAYLLDTAPEPKAAKHGPLNKNHLVKTHFLGNTPRKKQKRGVP